MRSHKREPVHKVCADWNTTHPGAARFVSDKPRRIKSYDDYA
ncbi:hypothetical protein [Streptomyces sp. NBC_00467]